MEVPMELIHETDYYTFQINRLKNRMYLKYRGFWKKPDQVPDFVKHHDETISHLRPGFTALVDVRQMEGLIITDVIEEVQRHAVKAGIRKAARVYDKPTFKQVQADSMHEKSGMKGKGFFSVEEAEAWLDD
jgi:hypothetical protein